MSGIESSLLKFDTEVAEQQNSYSRRNSMDNKKQDSKKGNPGRESGRESSEKGNQGGTPNR